MYKIGFIGLGLIGGSLARTVKKKYPDSVIAATDLDTAALELAVEQHIIDKAAGLEEIIGADFLKELDYLFLCAPVITNIKLLNQLAANKSEHVIITDVGSVKTQIAEAAKELGMKGFIGGHPMAGSEKTGFENSTDHLLENVYYILTNDSASKEQVTAFADFIASLDAIPIIMDAAYHDYIMSGISHMPHYVAAALVKTVKDYSQGERIFKTLAAGGFKDITRIASSSPEMWAQIALSNKDNITGRIDKLQEYLSQIKDAIENGDSKFIKEFFADAGEYRGSISDSGLGALVPKYSFHCDLADEKGGLARVTGILADGDVNIKNIGIVHNREYIEGALLLEFYDERSMKESMALLEKNNYTIYL